MKDPKAMTIINSFCTLPHFARCSLGTQFFGIFIIKVGLFEKNLKHIYGIKIKVMSSALWGKKNVNVCAVE